MPALQCAPRKKTRGRHGNARGSQLCCVRKTLVSVVQAMVVRSPARSLQPRASGQREQKEQLAPDLA
jgi:hypothetical protein